MKKSTLKFQEKFATIITIIVVITVLIIASIPAIKIIKDGMPFSY